MKKEYNIVELFSGIGSQARALKNIGININVQATCEWDIHAFIAYDALHESCFNLPKIEQQNKQEILEKLLHEYTLSNDGKTAMSEQSLRCYNEEVLKRILSAIIRTHNLVDISQVKGYQMPENTDILTYSFPCQDLSNVGAFHGYNKGIDIGSGSRSSLLWQVGRILTDMYHSGKSLPRYLIMENVPTLLSKRHRSNFEKWIKELSDLGYESQYMLVNAKNYGLPQNRPRLLMMSIFTGDNYALRQEIRKFFMTWGKDETVIAKEYQESKYYCKKNINQLLRLSSDPKSELWHEALECTPNDTVSRRKIWDENPKIVNEDGKITSEDFIRTITTKQDRNPNSGNIYFDSGIKGRGKFRYLTPRECLLFMGFTDNDYEMLLKNNPEQRERSKLFTRDKIIRMAGNSIPVKMLEGFFFQLYKTEEILEKY